MEKTNYIPLGFQCTVPTVLQAKQVKGQTLPFDWMLSSPKFVYQMIELLLSEMPIEVLVREHFFNCTARAEILTGEDGRVVLEHYITTKDGNSLYNQKYNVIFPHDKYDEEHIQKYIRRFERLKQQLQSTEHITYLYISQSSEQSGDFWIDGERVFALIQEFDEGEIKYSLMVSPYMYQNMTDLFKDKWIQIFKDWFELNSGLKINKIKIQ